MARDYEEAYTDDYFTQYDSTISNGEARIPICFCIDTSSSMQFVSNRSEDLIYEEGTYTEDGIDNVRHVKAKPGVTLHYRIEDVIRVLRKMIARIRKDRRIANAAVVSIVTFDMFADCIMEFSEVYNIRDNVISSIRTHEDVTNASKGINMCLDRLDQFRRVNSLAGNESYKPVLVFISDGSVASDSGAAQAGQEVRRRSDEGNLNVIPIAIGGSADETWMRRLSAESHVYHMEYEDEFDRVFDIITTKIARTASVISVDEGLVKDTRDEITNPIDEEKSSKYGEFTSEDEFMDFLDGFMEGQ